MKKYYTDRQKTVLKTDRNFHVYDMEYRLTNYTFVYEQNKNIV